MASQQYNKNYVVFHTSNKKMVSFIHYNDVIIVISKQLLDTTEICVGADVTS